VPLARQHFFPFVDDFPGFYRLRKFLASAFFSFLTTDYMDRTDSRKRATGIFRPRLRSRAIDYHNVTAEALASDEASVLA